LNNTLDTIALDDMGSTFFETQNEKPPETKRKAIKEMPISKSRLKPLERTSPL
jgi:hypothetical protein